MQHKLFTERHDDAKYEQARKLGQMVGELRNLATPSYPPLTKKELLDGIKKVLRMDEERDWIMARFFLREESQKKAGKL